MDDIKTAISHLQNGELVAFPTETVYGLGADATSSDAVLKIYETKGRPSFNPLICHVDALAGIDGYAELTDLDRLLAETFWPGPMTLILNKAPDAKLSDLVTAGLDTVGFRIPDHDIARGLLKDFAKPVAAPSANISGRISPTSWQDVEASFGEDVFTLRGEQADIGIESTILRASGSDIEILRPGAITKEMIESATGTSCFIRQESGSINAPGQLASHYAPLARMTLKVSVTDGFDGLLDFGGQFRERAQNLPQKVTYLDLSPKGDLKEAAKNLFSYMRKLDETALNIGVAPIPYEEIGTAINDRLKRAAAPRD